MKRLLAMFMLAIFLMAGTALGELLRYPVLLHHFSEHEMEGPVTWVEFIKDHYSGKINHQDDQHNDHQKMPFKSFNINSLQIAIVQDYTFISAVGSFIFAKQKDCFLRESYLSKFSSKVWQPPRSY